MKNVILYLTFIGIAITPIKTFSSRQYINQPREKGRLEIIVGRKDNKWLERCQNLHFPRQRDGKLSAMI